MSAIGGTVVILGQRGLEYLEKSYPLAIGICWAGTGPLSEAPDGDKYHPKSVNIYLWTICDLYVASKNVIPSEYTDEWQSEEMV